MLKLVEYHCGCVGSDCDNGNPVIIMKPCKDHGGTNPISFSPRIYAEGDNGYKTLSKNTKEVPPLVALSVMFEILHRSKNFPRPEVDDEARKALSSFGGDLIRRYAKRPNW